jgi:hypothetical protein
MRRPLLILALALVGCGGGGGDANEELIADANRICREGERRITEVAQAQQAKLRQAKTAQAQRRVVAGALEQTAAAYQPYLDRLRGLEPPEELADGWTGFLDGVEEAFDLIPELADATRDGDRVKLAELAEKFTDIARRTRPFAEHNGLDDCLPDEAASA